MRIRDCNIIFGCGCNIHTPDSTAWIKGFAWVKYFRRCPAYRRCKQIRDCNCYWICHADTTTKTPHARNETNADPARIHPNCLFLVSFNPSTSFLVHTISYICPSNLSSSARIAPFNPPIFSEIEVSFLFSCKSSGPLIKNSSSASIVTLGFSDTCLHPYR